MEQASNLTTISFLCDPTVYKYVEAAGKALYRPQSQQINFLLQLALELREEDEDVEVFRNWLQKQKEQENQQKEKWLEKELALLKQGLQKHKWS